MAVNPAETEAGPGDASQRQLMRRAATVGLLMRNCVNLVVSLVSLADPGSHVLPPGRWLLVALALWSLYRIATRSQHAVFLAVDYAFVLAICAALPILDPDPTFYWSNSMPQAIAGTAVISFSVVLPPYFSLPMAGVVAVTYAWGAAGVVGWQHVGAIPALYYFALQWITSALIRIMLLRVAAAVDGARNDRQAAE